MSRESAGQEEPHGGDPEREEWDDLVLDESFVREAEVKEPSARTRMLNERWKREAPTPQPWRSDEPPAGWIFGSGRRRQRPRRSGKRRWFRRKGKDDGGE
ncbi:SGM_3592 family protein [Streptomyces mayteni]